MRSESAEELKPLVYTVKEVAKQLKISERKVWQLVSDETLQAFRIGSNVRIRVVDLNAYLVSTPYKSAEPEGNE